MSSPELVTEHGIDIIDQLWQKKTTLTKADWLKIATQAERILLAAHVKLGMASAAELEE